MSDDELPPAGAGMPQDALALLRECQDRVLEREGIPMVLALVDEAAGDRTQRPVPDASAMHEGARLAALMDDLARELAPTGRDGDLGRVVMVLQALSYRDFGQGRTLL